jgi:hypothetical protein
MKFLDFCRINNFSRHTAKFRYSGQFVSCFLCEIFVLREVWLLQTKYQFNFHKIFFAVHIEFCQEFYEIQKHHNITEPLYSNTIYIKYEISQN